jgi:hypothetical protein
MQCNAVGVTIRVTGTGVEWILSVDRGCSDVIQM